MFDLLTANSDTLWKIVNGAWIVSLVLWLCVRAGSTHVLLSRAWRLVQGKSSRTDPVIARWLNGRDALIQFRVMSGAPVRTLANAHRLIAWAEAQNEDVADIARCGQNFDVETLRLKAVPHGFWLLVAIVVLAASVATLVLSTTATFAPRAWVNVREPGAHTLYLSPSDARVWPSKAHFGRSDCETSSTQVLAGQVGLSASEVTAVCGWFADPKLAEHLDTTLREQRQAFGLLAVLAAFYAWTSRNWVACTVAARALGKRLATPQPASERTADALGTQPDDDTDVTLPPHE
ncbi:DUF6216 family protein [Luteibacter yeojuensis]|uniref:Uncharacterized protein n=1 Tax=Luteibacter yeojuensis TaxID=345309 RepID=A0A0F3KUC2_9GAMM|nr:DUF6216 family protein [Luteibacter yeojuensis]KJV34823.1 hypothetical protein VI08_09610 [Luteibacter yeojuensis]